jgi:predicted Rossmann-fold nucleotide-binding protein
MKKPAIAIVGSIDPTREYQNPIRDPERGRKMARELGAALAKRGWRIIVSAPGSRFIESEVVQGFVGSGSARPRSVVVEFPVGKSTADFPEFEQNHDVFELRPFTGAGWEIAYYRSLGRADGVVLIGGGQSTLITGVLSLTFGSPVLAIPTHGGAAEKVWELLSAERHLATEEQKDAMAQPATPEVMEEWLDSLEAQVAARAKENESAPESPRRSWP